MRCPSGEHIEAILRVDIVRTFPTEASPQGAAEGVTDGSGGDGTEQALEAETARGGLISSMPTPAGPHAETGAEGGVSLALPQGHTLFSWEGGADVSSASPAVGLPCGHTAFSWGGDTLPLERQDVPRTAEGELPSYRTPR